MSHRVFIQFGPPHYLESKAGALEYRLVLKTRSRSIGWGSGPLLSAYTEGKPTRVGTSC